MFSISLAFATAGTVALFMTLGAGLLRGLGFRHAWTRHFADRRWRLNRHWLPNFRYRVRVLYGNGIGHAGALFLAHRWS